MTVPMIIPMAGLYFDRFMGGKLGVTATAMGSRLLNSLILDAYDADREELSRYLGSERFESQIDWYCRAYKYTGDDMAQITRKSDIIDWYATSDYVKLIDAHNLATTCWRVSYFRLTVERKHGMMINGIVF